MPFPWKKNRVTRISQIVADLQFQSPKRGGSLVVETGFPTSLIDLFVKNRSRFKKPKFRKPFRTEIHDPPPPPPPPSPATSSPPLTVPLILDASPPESPLPASIIGENTADGTSVSGPVLEPGCSGSVTKWFIVKMLTAVTLVAIVKGFTVGITVSAFSLLFLEYAGKRVVLYLSPCSNASVAMESMFQKVLLFQTKAKEECEPATVRVGDGVESELSLNLNPLNIDEIEVVEANSELGICDDYEPVVEPMVSECKIKGSRSGRFKSKMVKKLMSKKFRSSKKEKEEVKESKQNEAESGSEVSSVVGDSKLLSFEIEEVKNEVDCGITCSKESAFGRVGNSGYTILVIIALAGLIVGRLPALGLTIVWCFILKIVRALWRSQSVFAIKGSVANS